ncbi:hypothetical protein GUITHDRAFT_134679 [Guillardia theta CCMP2712]|uniref:Uncharacterized protein n=1 Tax=Guillardia theta (strain CCMP2712) TaxID=905079 RepID=L1JSV7_GUITC|nr:hypothetical protein GUITHDRAFT_134679 [Guillardia theta CCMP2712]EKX51168.1 hypothetical protein GUITHDRAFT_134679 [Guillardia theta CCMP2712]|eukprot:XP_005838148.1 hypothetical protein GUITHDRAFT_134679 [Guillardia theta CCMP2712]
MGGDDEALVGARRLLLGILVVMSALAVVFMLVSDDGSGTRTNLLTSMLCCEGQAEIDYTANGHRVSQHMESALNELNNIEDHVKSGMPKFLKESAAQREADLMNQKFTQDLQGDAKPRAELAVKAKHDAIKKLGQNDLEEAAKMDTSLKKDAKNDKKLYKTSNVYVSRGVEEAEKEAKKAVQFKSSETKKKLIEETSKKPKASPAKEALNSYNKKVVATGPSGSSPDLNKEETVITHFVPITSVGLEQKEQKVAKLDQLPHSKKSDVDEEIVYRLAAKDMQFRDEQMKRQAHKAVATGKEKVLANKDNGEQKKVVNPPEGDESKPAVQKPHVVSQKKNVKSPHTEKRLSGVLNRIDNLIGGYTGGASRHSKFFRHFDSERAKQAAQLKLSAYGPGLLHGIRELPTDYDRMVLC